MEQKIYISADQRAKNKVEKLKRFYSHLIIYLVINILITCLKLYETIGNWEAFKEELFSFGTFSTWTIWGIVLAIHAFSVFGINAILGYDWEERKIEQFMKEDAKYKN